MAMLLAGSTVAARGANVVLFDFEEDTQGWENESPTPAPVQISGARARHGKSSLVVKHFFTKDNKIMQCRVKEGFEHDVTKIAGFAGYSAWIYIPNGLGNWEAKMFVRSGEDWKWGEGVTEKHLEPGWHKVLIPVDKITHPNLVQDMGVEVINYTEKIESLICIDDVEMIVTGPGHGTSADK